MENQVVVNDLKRTFKSTKGLFKKEKKLVEAVKGISFDIKKGEVFGLLGENGAGKTTTIKILTTLLFPTSGSVEIMGYDPVKEADKIRPHINFVFGGERSLYWRLSARDNLKYFAELYRLDDGIKSKRIDEVLELVGLKEHQLEKVETYSKGMKQRLQIARGFINDPEIIFLDEPTIGLDPLGARDLRNIIKHLKELGKTILLTTHYMYEADELCDRIGLMKKGKLLTVDSPQNIKDKHSGLSIISIELSSVNETCLRQIKNLPGVINIHIKNMDQNQMMEIQCKQIADIMKDVMFILQDEIIITISSRENTLEDTYIKLIGEE